MLSKKLAVALTGTFLLCTTAGVGRAQDMADHRLADQALGSVPGAPEKVEDNALIVVEHTLGDGPAGTIVVRQGAAVRLLLHAPAGTKLHLHGYDLAGTAVDSAPVVMTFRADHVGRFPIGAHGVQDALGRSDRPLAYIEVRPE